VPPCWHAARGSLQTPGARQVRSFARGQGKSEQTIGALAGLLAAAGPFPRSISSFPWGVVSDRIGRKVPSPGPPGAAGASGERCAEREVCGRVGPLVPARQLCSTEGPGADRAACCAAGLRLAAAFVPALPVGGQPAETAV